MNIKYSPKLYDQIHTSLLYFIIVSGQIGIGIFSYERYIFHVAGHDAWISVLLMGAATHLIAWFIVRTVTKYESTDLFGINNDVFGKRVGTVFNTVYLLYYLLVMITIVRNYIEVVQAWIFPDMPSWVLAVMLLILTLYGGLGGIRTIVGMCVLGTVVIITTALLFYYPLKFAVWTQVFPVMETDPMKVLHGAWRMSFSLAGFEIIMFIFPYVRDKKKTMISAQFGILTSNILYTVIMVIAIVYFSPCQLRRSLWPSINMLKIVRYSFLERLEFIIVSLWMLIVLTGLILNSWIVLRGCKRMWNWNTRLVLIISLLLVLVGSLFMNEHTRIEKFNIFVGRTSAVLSFAYPVVLCMLASVILFVRKKKSLNKGE